MTRINLFCAQVVFINGFALNCAKSLQAFFFCVNCQAKKRLSERELERSTAELKGNLKKYLKLFHDQSSRKKVSGPGRVRTRDILITGRTRMRLSHGGRPSRLGNGYIKIHEIHSVYICVQILTILETDYTTKLNLV